MSSPRAGARGAVLARASRSTEGALDPANPGSGSEAQHRQRTNPTNPAQESKPSMMLSPSSFNGSSKFGWNFICFGTSFASLRLLFAALQHSGGTSLLIAARKSGADVGPSRPCYVSEVPSGAQ